MDLEVLALSILGRHSRSCSRDGTLNLWSETIMLTVQSFLKAAILLFQVSELGLLLCTYILFASFNCASSQNAFEAIALYDTIRCWYVPIV